jgi:hypothetical protein
MDFAQMRRQSVGDSVLQAREQIEDLSECPEKREHLCLPFRISLENDKLMAES